MEINYVEILKVLVIVLVFAYLYYRGQKKLIYDIVYNAVVNAETTYGIGTGEIKYVSVVAQVYDILPVCLRIFLTPKVLDKIIEDRVEDLQEFLKKQGAELI